MFILWTRRRGTHRSQRPQGSTDIHYPSGPLWSSTRSWTRRPSREKRIIDKVSPERFRCKSLSNRKEKRTRCRISESYFQEFGWRNSIRLLCGLKPVWRSNQWWAVRSLLPEPGERLLVRLQQWALQSSECVETWRNGGDQVCLCPLLQA